MGNSATSKVIGEGTIQFRSHDGCITTLQGVRHVPESRYNLISLRALHRKGFSFTSECDLMKVYKEAHVKFQIERVSNVYMLRNSEVIVSGLQLFSASRSMVVEQSENMMVLSSDVMFYPEDDWDLATPAHNKKVKIVTPMVKQILINPAWIKDTIG